MSRWTNAEPAALARDDVFWLDEASEIPEDTWRRFAKASHDYERLQRVGSLRQRRRSQESPRRRALFAKAEAAMQVMVAVRGHYHAPITVTAWYGRHGRRLGLFTYYDNDHEIQWAPRGGFKIVEIQDIPF